MSDPIYCEREDVYLHGLPRGSLAQRPRAIASIDPSTNRIEVEGHGCELDTPLQFGVDEDGELPPELSVSTVYYGRPVTDSESLLEVAATPGGSAINLSEAGSGSFRLIIPIGPLLDRLREVFSRWVDTVCSAHVVPFAAPYPVWVTDIVATRTASRAAMVLGLGSQAERLFQVEAEAIKDFMRTAQAPLRDARATAQTPFARGVSPQSGRFGSCDPKVIP